MAELSCGGTLKGETMSCASTRPRASKMPTVCTSVTGLTIRARKVLTDAADSDWGS